MAMLRVFVRLPNEIIDALCDKQAIREAISDDILRTVTMAIQKLQRDAQAAGRKPSEQLRDMFTHNMFPDEPVIVERHGSVALGVCKELPHELPEE